MTYKILIVVSLASVAFAFTGSHSSEESSSNWYNHPGSPHPHPGYPGSNEHYPRPGYPGSSEHYPRPGYPGSNEHYPRPGYPGSNEHYPRPGYPGSSEHYPRPGYPDSNEDYKDHPRYDFHYRVNDKHYNDYGHWEHRDGYVTRGRYFTRLPDTRIQTVTYYVDKDSGYRARVTYKGKAVHPKYTPHKYGYKPDSYEHQPGYYPSTSYRPDSYEHDPDPY